MRGGSPVDDDDDDTEKDGVQPKPNLRWEDDGLQGQILESLNQMRKNKHFCDVVLQVIIPSLAAAAGFLIS